MGPSVPPTYISVLAGLNRRHLVDQVIAGATEKASKRKMIQKVASFILDLLARPLFMIPESIAEGLIEGAC